MSTHRVKRLNSLLKEVISETIRSAVRNPKVSELMTVTQVDITKDLQHAKVYISVIGTDEEKKETLAALQSGAGFIGTISSKKVVMRHFPTLTFKLDETVDKHMRIDSLLQDIQRKKPHREDDN